MPLSTLEWSSRASEYFIERHQVLWVLESNILGHSGIFQHGRGRNCHCLVVPCALRNTANQSHAGAPCSDAVPVKGK